MSTDRREQILVQLVAIAEAVPGIIKVVRNRIEISEEQRPAIAILDADEIAEEGVLGGRKLPGPSPRLVNLSPEMYLMLGALAAGINVGTQLNGFRLLILAAVLNDPTLTTLVGSNGEIRYDQCATALARGRTMEAEMGLGFTFRYVLNPSEL